MMRRMMIIFLMLTLTLAACQPAQAPLSEEPPAEEEPTPEPDREPQDGIYPPPETPTTGGDSLGDAPPVLAWDDDPNTVVVSGTFCCGFVPYLAVINYIPEVQIYGDGRYIWVEQHENGGRTVRQGQLSQDEIGELLQSMVDAGFFRWDDQYVDQSVADVADKCLVVNLRGASKSVCEYYRGAPQAFHALFDRLATGAGASGSEFVPERGYMIATPLKSDFQLGGGQTASRWDAGLLEVSLAEAGSGTWLTGPSLEIAWQVVNAQPFFPLVEQDGTYYEISLQIPDLSREAPPAE